MELFCAEMKFIQIDLYLLQLLMDARIHAEFSQNWNFNLRWAEIVVTGNLKGKNTLKNIFLLQPGNQCADWLNKMKIEKWFLFVFPGSRRYPCYFRSWSGKHCQWCENTLCTLGWFFQLWICDYESFSDVGEIRVYFASKILTPCRMYWNAFLIAQIIAKCHSFPNMYGML